MITTAVTNMDIHDIARSARTYGADGYFLVTPIGVQHELVGRILSHWHTESSKAYHPDRFSALSLVQVKSTFEDVKNEIFKRHGELPEVVLTDARPILNSITYADFRREWESSPQRTRPLVVVFGTGYGVAKSFLPEVDRVLTPIYGNEKQGRESYNHLSVRAAAAIVLDRLFGH